MLEALCHHLLKKHGLYLDEMAIFPWEEFQMLAMPSSGRPSHLIQKDYSTEGLRVLYTQGFIRGGLNICQ
jgi:hypothetical protein